MRRAGPASPSSQRAWIEIESQISYTGVQKVALLAEGVDRNTTANTSPLTSHVALLAEGVDRNLDAKDDPQRLKGRPPRRGRG